MVAPQKLDVAWNSPDNIIWVGLNAYKILYPIPNNAFSTITIDLVTATSCFGVGNCYQNLRRLKAKPTVMNNTVVSIFG